MPPPRLGALPVQRRSGPSRTRRRTARPARSPHRTLDTEGRVARRTRRRTCARRGSRYGSFCRWPQPERVSPEIRPAKRRAGRRVWSGATDCDRLLAREGGWPEVDAIVLSHLHLGHWGDVLARLWGSVSGPGAGLAVPEIRLARCHLSAAEPIAAHEASGHHGCCSRTGRACPCRRSTSARRSLISSIRCSASVGDGSKPYCWHYAERPLPELDGARSNPRLALEP